MAFTIFKTANAGQKTRWGKLWGKQMGDCAKTARCAVVFSALGFGHVRSLAVIAIGGLQMRNLMREFLVALIFLVGTVFLLGGELFFGHLFSVPSVAIGIGAVLCVLATIAKDQIDRDMTL